MTTRPRPGRLHTLVAVAAVSTLALLVGAGAAGAQPSTTPTPPPPGQPAPGQPAPTVPPGLEEYCKQASYDVLCAPGIPGGPVFVPDDPNRPAEPPQVYDVTHEVKMDGLFNIETGYGPLSNYNIFADTPWLVDDPMPAIWLALGNIGFSFGKYMVGFAVWFTEWAMSYQMLSWLRGPAEALEKIWQTQLIGTLKLREIALIIATLYLALLFLRGYTRRAWREMISTVLINVLAVVIITHPVAFLLGDATEGGNKSVIDGGLLILTRDISTDVAAALMGRTPSDARNPATDMTQEEIKTLLVMPWETLNWGEPVSQSKPGKVNPCFPHSQDMLKRGPWSDNDDTPRTIMEKCNGDYAGYNANMSVDRMFGAWAYAIAMVLFLILTIALMLIQVLAPYLLLFEGMLLVGALIVALIPRFQNQLTRRIASIATTLGHVLVTVLFLAIMIVLLRSLMMVDLGPQLIRFGVIDLTVFAGFFFRKRLNEHVSKMKATVHRGLQRAGRPRRPTTPLPAGIRVPPGKTRIGTLVGAHTDAFKQTLAPAQQLRTRMTSATKTAGHVGAKTAAATIGAPVSWPKAAGRAKTTVLSKASQLRGQLGKAHGYASTYTSNISKAAGAVATVTGLRGAYGLANTGAIKLDSHLTAAPAGRGARTAELRGEGGSPIAERLAAFTPTSTATLPPLAADTHVIDAPAPLELPPGMLPNPPSAADKLRERLRRHREGRS